MTVIGHGIAPLMRSSVIIGVTMPVAIRRGEWQQSRADCIFDQAQPNEMFKTCKSLDLVSVGRAFLASSPTHRPQSRYAAQAAVRVNDFIVIDRDHASKSPDFSKYDLDRHSLSSHRGAERISNSVRWLRNVHADRRDAPRLFSL